ncbi:unnamed protein product [Sphagnum balticum]
MMMTLRWEIMQKMVLCSASSDDSASWEVGAFGSEDLCSSGMQLQWPPSSYSCSFCHREFRTAQALGGHMNVHRRERAAHKNAGQRETSSALAHQPLLAPVLTPDRRRRAAGPHQLHRDPAAPSCSDDPPQLLLTSSQLVDFFSHGSLANRGTGNASCRSLTLVQASEHHHHHQPHHHHQLPIKSLDLELRLGHS